MRERGAARAHAPDRLACKRGLSKRRTTLRGERVLLDQLECVTTAVALQEMQEPRSTSGRALTRHHQSGRCIPQLDGLLNAQASEGIQKPNHCPGRTVIDRVIPAILNRYLDTLYDMNETG